jgi:membrane fusion protein (multidrug efflux system)
VGEKVGSLWIIEDGLKVGDQVVVEGMQRTRDGQTVKPVAWSTPTPPPGR